MDQGQTRAFVYSSFVRIERSFSRTWLLGMRAGSSTTPPCRLDPAQRTAADLHLLKTMLCCWYDAKGMLYFELLPQSRTVSDSIYTDQLEKLAAAIQEKRPRRASVHLLGKIPESPKMFFTACCTSATPKKHQNCTVQTPVLHQSAKKQNAPCAISADECCEKQKVELRKLVHSTFDGTNAKEVLKDVNQYVFNHVTDEQWLSMVPRLQEYQSKNHECSIYAQLLPTDIYKKLLSSVFRASEMGASKYDVKRLVEDYVERLAKGGILPDVNSIETPELPLVTLPPQLIASQGYRNSQSYRKFSKYGGPVDLAGEYNNRQLPTNIYPTLIGFPQTAYERPRPLVEEIDYNYPPPFPLVRPTSYDLSKYGPPTRQSIRRLRLNNGRRQPSVASRPRILPANFCDEECVAAAAKASAAAS
ncbi:unnamed protein product [Caenorhabditis auriculariae]|uniref:Uncharacterized protein n=1 Tax=Caenorhabditis auriculariae TaxID=2777116 RepID=A0A8S1HHP1_9PELO|nr:unnamed protein product [Caenorhabditis auriculariae]